MVVNVLDITYRQFVVVYTIASEYADETSTLVIQYT